MATTAHGLARRRWSQLALGIACVVAIADLQYGWTLFIEPIHQKHGWSIAAIQWIFTIAVTTETFLATPLGGRLADRFGPRLSWISGPLIALAWSINSVAEQLVLFYLAAVFSGLGAGLVFAATYARRCQPRRAPCRARSCVSAGATIHRGKC